MPQEGLSMRKVREILRLSTSIHKYSVVYIPWYDLFWEERNATEEPLSHRVDAGGEDEA